MYLGQLLEGQGGQKKLMLVDGVGEKLTVSYFILKGYFDINRHKGSNNIKIKLQVGYELAVTG